MRFLFEFDRCLGYLIGRLKTQSGSLLQSSLSAAFMVPAHPCCRADICGQLAGSKLLRPFQHDHPSAKWRHHLGGRQPQPPPTRLDMATSPKLSPWRGDWPPKMFLKKDSTKFSENKNRVCFIGKRRDRKPKTSTQKKIGTKTPETETWKFHDLFRHRWNERFQDSVVGGGSFILNAWWEFLLVLYNVGNISCFCARKVEQIWYDNSVVASSQLLRRRCCWKNSRGGCNRWVCQRFSGHLL